MTKCVNCAKFKGCDLSSPNVNECADYKEILTNEEWFCGLTTEEKARFLQSISVLSLESKDEDLEDWKRWLKQPHHNEVEK